MKRARLLLALTVAVAVTGCHGHEGTAHRSEAPIQALDGPTFVPLTGATPFSATPGPLTGEPSLDAVKELAHAGPNQLDGERYALVVAQLLTDVRPRFEGEDVLSQVASPRMPTRTRAALVADVDGQRQLGMQRHIDTRLDMWIRSRPYGPATALRAITVEVVSNIEAAGGRISFWDRARYEVVREGDTWRLISAASGGWGPSTARNLTPAQRREVLGASSAWRRIPAAVTP